MKRPTICIGLILAVCGILLNSCNDISNVDAPYRAQGDKVIQNAKNAQDVLRGVYSLFRSSNYTEWIEFTSALGLTNNNTSYLIAATNNDVSVKNSFLRDIYTANYKIIQEANLFLEKVKKVSNDKMGGAVTKKNFIAEGRFIRAIAHFNLLRLFGQFYDTSSKYGVILRKKPANDGTAKSRSSVKATYDFIMKDLDYAIPNLTETVSYRANADAAKALKAKVLLYQQHYSDAYNVAKKLIQTTSRKLQENYAQIFKDGVDSPEMLFGPYVNFNDNEKLGGASGVYFVSSQSKYAIKATGDPRFGLTFFPSQGVQKYEENFTPINKATHIELRLAEVYLICAEAAARSSASAVPGNTIFDNGVAKLNAVRNRVNLPAKHPKNKKALLKDIRKEKLLELWGENGEEWFDLVRYASIKNDLSIISKQKPSVTDMHQLIMPIPFRELASPGGKDVMQNPGYSRQP